MEPLGPLARAVHRFLYRLRPPSAAERRAHAEAAIDRYLAWCDGYAEALSRKSAREAAHYALTGEPADAVPAELAGIKRDDTGRVLRHYQLWLELLRAQGVYDGSVALKRQRADGSWELLDLGEP